MLSTRTCIFSLPLHTQSQESMSICLLAWRARIYKCGNCCNCSKYYLLIELLLLCTVQYCPCVPELPEGRRREQGFHDAKHFHRSCHLREHSTCSHRPLKSTQIPVILLLVSFPSVQVAVPFGDLKICIVLVTSL